MKRKRSGSTWRASADSARHALTRFALDDAGFAAAESALLALLLIGICLAVGKTLQAAATSAARSLNEELAGN